MKLERRGEGDSLVEEVPLLGEGYLAPIAASRFGLTLHRSDNFGEVGSIRGEEGADLEELAVQL